MLYNDSWHNMMLEILNNKLIDRGQDYQYILKPSIAYFTYFTITVILKLSKFCVHFINSFAMISSK